MEVVVDRLAGDEVVVIQGDALRTTISRHTQIAIVTIVGDYCACCMQQAVMESAIFVVPSEQGEEHVVIVCVTHANFVLKRLSTFEEEALFGR